MQFTRDHLKPFQLKAAGELSQMLATYPSEPYEPWFNPRDGKPYPFLCRLRAITGSGKTPMLALASASLGDAIVLWTTNRGAIISQTLANLSAGGRYAGLLPNDTRVLDLSDLSTSDWNEVVTEKSGLTILLSTVAAFNQDNDKLKIHQLRGDTSHWEMLAGRGPEGRRRDLYVIYDEGHGATDKQFRKLTELNPRALILASASELPDDLSDLVPGVGVEEKSKNLERQTVSVDTPAVVETGLLKTRLYLVDCNTTRRDALKEANDKWFDLSQKLKASDDWPIMCCIVNSTLAGLEVWETLTQDLKVDPRRIAVHLASVSKAMPEANPNVAWGQLIDTHKAGKTPEALHDEGYTHLIWNLSLREGWDEPWAYVAYLDGIGKSSIDITQKIGRFLRQPNATPFDDGDLNSAYFYFNVEDKDFQAILDATQRDLGNQGYEVISISASTTRPKSSRESPVKRKVEIAQVKESFGEDVTALDQILLDNVTQFGKEALRSQGRITIRVLDLRRNEEDGALRKEETRDENAEIRVWDYLIARLAAQDSRIAQKNGHRFSPFVKEHRDLKQKMQFGSQAMEQINKSVTTILSQLNDEFRLVHERDQKYEVKPFNMVSPDLQIDDLVKRERYKVRRYVNALHEEYNAMNPFEVEVAAALDALKMQWCRNPSKTGYSIPIPEIGQGTNNFYPDFLLWAPKCLWAIDPKGAHLMNDAIRNKMLGVSDVDGLKLKIRVALIVQGRYSMDGDNRPKLQIGDGCTLIHKPNTGPKARAFDSPQQLVEYLITQ